MADVPATNTMPLMQGIISPCDITSIGAIVGTFSTPASAAWPTLYLAIFVPIRVSVPVKTTSVWWYNGATVNASYKIDVGIYSADFTKLGSIGLTAQGTALVIQSVALATEFGPGLFYMAMTHNYIETFWRWNGITASCCAITGMFQQPLSNPYSLPAVATPATVGYAYIPVFGITARSFI